MIPYKKAIGLFSRVALMPVGDRASLLFFLKNQLVYEILSKYSRHIELNILAQI